MSRKNTIHHVDVIHQSDRSVSFCLVLLRVELCQFNEQFIVRPGFVFEEGVEEGWGGHGWFS
jgi:hypothetical protein